MKFLFGTFFLSAWRLEKTELFAEKYYSFNNNFQWQNWIKKLIIFSPISHFDSISLRLLNSGNIWHLNCLRLQSLSSVLTAYVNLNLTREIFTTNIIPSQPGRFQFHLQTIWASFLSQKAFCFSSPQILLRVNNKLFFSKAVKWWVVRH